MEQLRALKVFNVYIQYVSILWNEKDCNLKKSTLSTVGKHEMNFFESQEWEILFTAKQN